MSRLSLMIDIERCIGCKSCEAACKAEHGLGPGEYRNRVVWLGDTERPALDFLTLSCQHCERPACLRACPVNPKAIHKHPDTGVVAIDESLCTGCGECVVACPYGAMGYNAQDHHAVKCDLCSDRREAGRRPACATVCPGEAISFGERDDHLKRVEQEGREIIDHDAFLLGPGNIFIDRLERVDAPASDIAPKPLATVQVEARQRPAIVDDPKRKLKIKADAVGFPYGASREARQPDTVVPGGCNICFNCCSTEYHLRDGRLVRVTGNENDPLWKGKVCPKSQFLLQLYNNEERLTQPLKRIGKRGEGRFEPISWEQALDEIADKLKLVRDTSGPEALGVFAGTRTGTLTRNGYIRVFTQMFGTPNLADTEGFCSASKALSFETVQGAVGSGNSYTEADLGSAALYVYIGDNQAESRPVHFGMINNWRLNNGARMIAVDPRLTATASKADKWLGIRSGTDMALGLALSYHILENDLHDHVFCDTNTVGVPAWHDYLKDKGYSPEWAAPITGIATHEIKSLAEEIAAADGCVIFAARGVNQHASGTQTNRVYMFLAAITGNWGRKGGAYWNFGTGTGIVANAPEHRRVHSGKPGLGTNPVTWVEATLAEQPYALKAVITNNNPMTAWPNQSRVREAFEALELLVHVELFANETTKFADYVLPAATGIEKGEVSRASEDRRVVWIDKMIEPPGEAKADGWIWIELGKRLGFNDVLKEEYKDSALFWDEMCINAPGMRGCTQKRLHSVPWRWVRAPVFTEESDEIETMYLEGSTAHGAPDGHRFPTPSGRLEFYTDVLEQKFASLGLSAFPEFYSDREQLVDTPYLNTIDDNARSPFEDDPTLASAVEIVQPNDAMPARVLRDKGFDMHLVTGRPPAPHFHSWTHYSWQAQEMWPDMYVQVHPDRAAELGVQDGQEISVETGHGKLSARAWLHAGIREDTVFVPIGWDASQPYHPWQSVNFLTDKDQRDPLSAHANLKTYLCRIRPLES